MAGIFNSAIFNNAIFNTGSVVPPTPAPSGGGWQKRRRGRVHGLGPEAPESRPVVVIAGRMLAVESPDTFHATGDAHESDAQIQVRRNARTLAVLMMG